MNLLKLLFKDTRIQKLELELQDNIRNLKILRTTEDSYVGEAQTYVHRISSLARDYLELTGKRYEIPLGTYVEINKQEREVNHGD